MTLLKIVGAIGSLGWRMTSVQDRIQKSRPQGKSDSIFQSFQVFAAKIDLAQNETKWTVRKEKPNQTPNLKEEKINQKPIHPCAPSSEQRGCSWNPVLSDRQKWRPDTTVLRQLTLNSRTQTRSGFISISHFSWEKMNTRCPLDPKGSPPISFMSSLHK